LPLLEPLTSRESEILRRVGQGRSNRDIAEELTMSLETVRWYVKQLYSKLGVHSRAEAVIRAIGLGLLEAETPVPSTLLPTHSPIHHNLPLPATLLVGRLSERAAVKDLLSTARCVTLTGPAGVGKTRLSVQVATELIDRYPQGVFFVDLAPITDPALIVSAVTDALSGQERTLVASVATLKTYLRGKKVLLVLDNFEQIITGAPVVSDLLSALPELTVLITSREILRISGEHVFPVSPLSLPVLDKAYRPADLLRYDAVSLFVQRAQAANPGFELTENNAAVVAEICVRLDGLPLALELAAARTKLLNPQALLGRLESRFATLTTGMRDSPHRQQTLRDAIEWSYRLLTPAEQVLFSHLGVFSGGQSLAAVEAICGPVPDLDVLDGVESLLDKNLLQQAEDVQGESLFTMLETIHEYARERLAQSSEVTVIRQRHAEYFLNLAEQAAAAFRGPANQFWMIRLEIELDNLRQVLGWSLDNHEAALGVRLATALEHFWFMQGYHTEGLAWLERMLGVLADVPRSLHAGLLNAAGNMAYFTGDYERGKAWCRQALAVSRELDDKPNTAWALTFLSGQSIGNSEEYVAAVALCEEGLAIFTELSLPKGMVQAMNVLGELTRAQDDYDRAEAYYCDCIEVSRQTGEEQRIAMCLGNLGYIAYHLGDFDRAEQYTREAFALVVRLRAWFWATLSLSTLAGPIAAKGNPERAACLLGAGEALLEELGVSQQKGDQMETDRYIAAVRAQLDPTTFASAWARGRAMSLEEAIDLALQ
jgi:predicted ATPase/DNA-binding CsgD family transcriptional regulator